MSYLPETLTMTEQGDWCRDIEEAIRIGGANPPDRRDKLNQIWTTYRRWILGDFSGFIEAGNLRVELNWPAYITQFYAYATVTNQLKIEPNIPKLTELLRETTRHLIVYGSAAFLVLDNKITVIDPRWWYPIRDHAGIEHRGEVIILPIRTRHHALIPDKALFWIQEPQSDQIRIGDLSMSGTRIRVINETRQAPGIIIPISTRGIYGISTMQQIPDPLAEIFRRYSQASNAMDKQANPHLAIPAASIEYTTLGEPIISKDGSTIPLEPGDPRPRYVSWDGNYEPHMALAEVMEQRLLMLAGINPAIVGQYSNANTFSVFASGAALRRLAITTVRKIEGLQSALARALETLVPYYTGAREVKIDWGVPLETPDPEALNLAREPQPENSLTMPSQK